MRSAYNKIVESKLNVMWIEWFPIPDYTNWKWQIALTIEWNVVKWDPTHSTANSCINFPMQKEKLRIDRYIHPSVRLFVRPFFWHIIYSIRLVQIYSKTNIMSGKRLKRIINLCRMRERTLYRTWPAPLLSLSLTFSLCVSETSRSF